MPKLPYIPNSAPFTAEQRAWLNGYLVGLFSEAEAEVDVTVQPKVNIDQVGGSETVIVTLVDGTDYDLSAPATATVTIAP
jgi:hypothetical protein